MRDQEVARLKGEIERAKFADIGGVRGAIERRSMGAAEELTFSLGTTLLRYRLGRLFVFSYSLLLHILVFFALGSSAGSQDSDSEAGASFERMPAALRQTITTQVAEHDASAAAATAAAPAQT